MPKKKLAPACHPGERRFTVVRVNGDPYDSHVGRSLEAALDLALPDRGATVEVFRTCAAEAGEARMPYNYEKRGRLVSRFRYKRGG